jgi:hypothetical protein
MTDFGVLKKVNIQEIWKNEASEFTVWLCNNLSALGVVLEMELELEKREADVGDFSLDILARDIGRNRLVVIENQFGRTDHKHLGQLLTYAAGYDSSAVVWIAEELREEHRQTLDWLNQNTTDNIDFYGVVIEVLRIDNSKPAYNFKLVAFPNEWRKTNISSGSQPSEKREAYRVYFQNLIDALRTRNFTNAQKGQLQSWYSFSSGLQGIIYSNSFAQGGRVRAELYIDRGDAKLNKDIFDKLLTNKIEIEKEFGEALEWERLDSKRASRIAIYRPGSIEEDDKILEEIKDWSIERLLKFKKVFAPIIKKYL